MSPPSPPLPTTGTERLLRLLFAASLVVPAVLYAGASWQERRLLLDDATQRAEKTAEVLEQHAAAAFHAYELIFGRVDEHLRLAPEEDEATRHAYLAGIDHELKEVGSLFLVAPDGEVTAHSRFFPTPVTNVSDRDYFQALLIAANRAEPNEPIPDDGPSAALGGGTIAIGAPVLGRFSATSKLNIARAVATPEGRFAGAIAISVSQDYFAAFQRTLATSPGDSLVLVRSDGKVLTRSPALTIQQMALSQTAALNRAVQARLAAGTVTYISPYDHIERITVYRKIAGYPVSVGYGLSTEAVLASWRQHLIVYGFIALLASLTLSSFSWLALNAAREEARARADLLGEMSRREAAEAALRQAQKMDALGQLTGGIAHDFNNLLAAVLGNLELLSKRLPADDPRLRRYLDGAIEGSRRGAALTQRMLAFSRRQELRFGSVDLAALVSGMADLLVRSLGASIGVETRFPARLAPAYVDANQLEMVLLNLAVNARDAMPKGGRIEISGREEDVVEGGPLGLAAGRYVALAVSDSGEGMSAETAARATEPFFTTKAVGKGTGLGLAMAHGLAAQSGGTLHIESREGEGTTIALWLPVATRPAEPEAAPPADRAGRAAQAIRVLLVDDDPLVLAGTAAMLDDLGHAVTEACSAREALGLLRAGTAVDLLITDQVMPGMTGLELAAEAKRLRPALPVILASGFAELSDVEAGSRPRLRKPFTQAALALAIAEAVPDGTLVPPPRHARDGADLAG